MRIIRTLVFAVALAICESAAAPGRPPQPLPARLLDQRLQAVHGPAATLRQYLGRPVVVNIWATWCPPCQKELPMLERAQRDHAEIRFVGIDQGESRARVRNYVQRMHVTYPVLLDPQDIYGAAAGFAFPTTVFINASGKIVQVHRGALDPTSLRAGIASLRRP